MLVLSLIVDLVQLLSPFFIIHSENRLKMFEIFLLASIVPFATYYTVPRFRHIWTNNFVGRRNLLASTDLREPRVVLLNRAVL